MTSCEQDIVEKEKLHQESHAKINPHEVNLDFFREQTGIIDLDEFYTKTIKATGNRKSAVAASDSISLNDFTIDKEHILMKIRSDSTTQVFTFRLETEVLSLRHNEYYNLVIAVDNEDGLHYQAYYLEEDTGDNTDSYFSTIRSLSVNKGELDMMLGKSGFSRVCSDSYTFHCPAPGNCDPDGGCDLCSDCVTVTVNCDWVYTSSPLTPVDEHFADEFVVNRPGGGGSTDDDDDDDQEMSDDPSCEKVGNKFARRDYDSIVNILRTKFQDTIEHGYVELDDQRFNELLPVGSNQLDFTPTVNTRGITHVHTDDRQITRTINGNQVTVPGPKTIRIQSPFDVHKFLEQLRILQNAGIPLSEAYNTVISSTGTWEIRVDDDFEIPDPSAFDPSVDSSINQTYRNILYSADEDDLSLTFLGVFSHFGLRDIKLYEIKDSAVYEHQLENNQVTKVKCHEE